MYRGIILYAMACGKLAFGDDSTVRKSQKRVLQFPTHVILTERKWCKCLTCTTQLPILLLPLYLSCRSEKLHFFAAYWTASKETLSVWDLCAQLDDWNCFEGLKSLKTGCKVYSRELWHSVAYSLQTGEEVAETCPCSTSFLHTSSWRYRIFPTFPV